MRLERTDEIPVGYSTEMSFGIAKQSYLCLDHGKESHDDLMLLAVRHVRTKSRLTSCDMV